MIYSKLFKQIEHQEDRELLWELLHHKCLYYCYPLYGSVLTDYEYDKLEKLWESRTGLESPVDFNADDPIGKSIKRIGAVKIKAYILDRITTRC